jgi:hypothetical protein
VTAAVPDNLHNSSRSPRPSLGRGAALFRGLNWSGFGRAGPIRCIGKRAALQFSGGCIQTSADRHTMPLPAPSRSFQLLAHDQGKWEPVFPSGRTQSACPEVSKKRHWILIRFGLIGSGSNARAGNPVFSSRSFRAPCRLEQNARKKRRPHGTKAVRRRGRF